jgi:hypothetical protein
MRTETGINQGHSALALTSSVDELVRNDALGDYSCDVLSVVSGVRRREGAGEQDKSDRRRIPDTTTCTKPLGKAYGDWFLIC